ncbi:hypothetical protein [Synechococcus sp. M16CYN]|uniref:hypothetical protein n=1 Tax=Synechococcus sp. M16CYN TaxID=3103139 RepID=UPI00333E436E
MQDQAQRARAHIKAAKTIPPLSQPSTISRLFGQPHRLDMVLERGDCIRWR